MQLWLARALVVMSWTLPDPPMKGFKAKNNLMTVEDYSKDAPAGYWDQFPVNMQSWKPSLIDHMELRKLASRANITGAWVTAVLNNIQEGANIGCRGEYRNASVSKNTSDAYKFGAQVSDAIASWIKKGFVRGPVELAAVPAAAKINGIMCRPKPDGSVRVILNLSAPEGFSVNDGICSDEFPAIMSSTKKWLSVLEAVGRGCEIMKIDWSDAYKHIPVRREDLKLQWFQWLGKAFQELCLIFGASSSVGIFDQVAKLVLAIVLVFCKFPAEWVCQHLDDVCAAAPKGSDLLRRFERTYRKVAEQVGVKLAPTDDPEKAFSACTEGTVLGVHYNTEKWTWSIPQDKLIRLVKQIEAVMSADKIKQKEMQSLAGRILHYAPLIPTGRFNLDHIIRASHQTTARYAWVEVSADLKRQLNFWKVLACVCHTDMKIPEPEERLPSWAKDVYTDAAGGSLDSVGRGCGIVAGEKWAYVQWPRKVNCGVKAEDGKKLGRKLSALELVGPLIAVAANPEEFRGQAVKIWVDNYGSVQIWKKGYSTQCELSTTLVKAIATVAASIGCKLSIMKIRRCSSTGAEMADKLSKAEFKEFWDLADKHSWQLLLEPMTIPACILAWVADPKRNENLGQEILEEIGQKHMILGYNC